jgi:hypothetical protein
MRPGLFVLSNARFIVREGPKDSVAFQGGGGAL